MWHQNRHQLMLYIYISCIGTNLVLLDTNNSLHNSSKYLLNPKNTGPVGYIGNANIIMSFSIMEHNTGPVGHVEMLISSWALA